jgi:5'-3' exoribonuclease 1
MGIPGYFSHIIKNYSTIINKIKSYPTTFDNLYIDSNSIIYDVLQHLHDDYDNNDEIFEQKIIEGIIEKLEYYIQIINPQKTVFIAFDGVAPFAKLEQQRNRRYKSQLEKKIKETIFNTKIIEWDRTAITPGTKFMTKLNAINTHFKQKNIYNNIQIIVSGVESPGEGEHKIFQYIRDNPLKHKNETTVIYGLDADLIVLCLNHIPVVRQIFLYRETPEFVKSINCNLDPNEDYILNIPELAKYIIQKMNNNKPINTTQQKNRLYDYILLTFFLGNDFMPHFPSMSIRTNGIDILENAYQFLFADTNRNLCDGTKLFWNNLYVFIEFLANSEHENLLNEYKIREKWSKREYPNKTQEDVMKKWLNLPTKLRNKELLIDPYSNGWEKRYYKELFNIDICPNYKQDICVNYLEGLEWTMKYYTSGCANTRWLYKYNYPPLLKDLLKYIPNWDINLIDEHFADFLLPEEQLSYVLPKNSLHLLSKTSRQKQIKDHGDYYDNDHEICWAFCKYFWESHVIFSHYSLTSVRFTTKP